MFRQITEENYSEEDNGVIDEVPPEIENQSNNISEVAPTQEVSQEQPS